LETNYEGGKLESSIFGQIAWECKASNNKYVVQSVAVSSNALFPPFRLCDPNELKAFAKDMPRKECARCFEIKLFTEGKKDSKHSPPKKPHWQASF
jgi:hypothetical protein